MRYAGNFLANIYKANNTKNRSLQKDMVFSELSELITENPDKVLEALHESGEKVSPNMSKKEIIDAVVKAFYSNESFRTQVGYLIGQYIIVKGEGQEYSNGTGEAIAGAVTGVVTAVSDIWTGDQDQKIEKERTRQLMIEKVFGTDNKNKNIVAIVAVAGVLVIAGVVIYLTLRQK